MPRQGHCTKCGAGNLQVMCGSLGMPTASVKMQGPDGVTRTASGMGTGPVDASYKAIDSLINIPVGLCFPLEDLAGVACVQLALQVEPGLI